MTATRSTMKSRTPFLTNFRLNILKNKKFLAAISIMSLLGLPLISIVVSLLATEPVNNAPHMVLLFVGFFCIGISILCGIAIAVNTFSYLYKKSEVDMIHSLPIKRITKFLSDFLSGLAIYILPIFLSYVLSTIILLITGNTITNMHEIVFNKNNAVLYFQIIFASILCMTLIYSLSVFVLNCCGTIFESIINIILINLVIPGAFASVSTMFFSSIYGIQSYLDQIIPAIGYTSPVGAVIYLVTESNTNYYIDVSYSINGIVFAKWAVMFSLFTILIITDSLYMNIKRKAEDVSKPYVFKILYYVTLTTIILAISLIARFDTDTIIAVVIFAFIIYMIFEVVTNRGFKKFYISIAKFAITGIIIFMVAFASDISNGFGIEKKVPDISSIKSVEVGYDGYKNVSMSYTFYNINNYEKSYVYEQKDIIEKITTLHKHILDTYYSGKYDQNELKSEYYYYNCSDGENCSEECQGPQYEVSFKYHMKTGNTISRTYRLTFEELKELWVLDNTPQMAERMYDELLDSTVYINYDYDHYEPRKEYSIEVNDIMKNYTDSKVLSKSEVETLAKAYKEDYSNMTYEQMLTDRTLCYIMYNMPVRESFKNTIECMRKLDIDIPNISYTQLYDYTHYDDVQLYKPSDIKCWGDDNISASFCECSGIYENAITNLTAETIADMLNNGYARPNYYEEENCYVLSIAGEKFVVPYKYTDYVEKLINSNISSETVSSYSEN